MLDFSMRFAPSDVELNEAWVAFGVGPPLPFSFLWGGQTRVMLQEWICARRRVAFPCRHVARSGVFGIKISNGISLLMTFACVAEVPVWLLGSWKWLSSLALVCMSKEPTLAFEDGRRVVFDL